MMKRILLSTVGLVAFAGVALANDTMDAMVGATVVYTYPDGTAVSAIYDANGTYNIIGAEGHGTWTINGDEICIETNDGQTGCTTLEPGHGVGDSWGGIDGFGNEVTIAIQ